MLTSPLFANTRGSNISKRIFHFLKLHSHTFWFLIALFLSAVFIVADRNQVEFMKSLRVYLMDFTEPVVKESSLSLGWIRSSFKDFKDLLAAHEHNKKLIQENHALKEWQELAYRLSAENKSLKQQLNIIKDETLPMLTARVMTYPVGLLAQNLLLNVGSKNGIRKGQPVIARNALLGRIVEVGKTSSRVLLITDLNSRIPVLCELSRDQAILAGTNSSMLKLTHFNNDNVIKNGERVITSGKGGLFPYGLLLGNIVIRNHVPYVVSPIIWNQLEYVQVLINPLSDQNIEDE